MYKSLLRRVKNIVFRKKGPQQELIKKKNLGILQIVFYRFTQK